MDSKIQTDAIYFDGLTSKPYQVMVTLQDNAVMVQWLDDKKHVLWSYQHICISEFPTKETPARISYQLSPDARLVLSNKVFFESLKSHLPKKETFFRNIVEHLGIGSICILIVGIALAIPLLYKVIESYIDPETETQLSGQLHTAFIDESLVCDSTDAQHAVKKIMDHITPYIDSSLGFDYRVTFIIDDAANAMTIGGGYIIFTDAFIEEAVNQGEFIGVLAHEIAHVELRHVRERIAQTVMFGLLDFAIGSGGLVTLTAFLQTSYSQRDEKDADIWAVNLLNRAGIDPKGLSDVFGRFAEKEKMMLEKWDSIYIGSMMDKYSTHPVSDKRQAYVLELRDDSIDYRPVLSNKEWDAIKYACQPKRQEIKFYEDQCVFRF